MDDENNRPGDNQPPGLRVLTGQTASKVAELVFDCYGVRTRHIRMVYPNLKNLKTTVAELVRDGFLRELEGMYYPGGEMLRLVSARDGSSIAKLSKGVEHAIYENHRRPVGKRFRHTDFVNDVLMEMKRQGFRVCGESRTVLDLPLLPGVARDRRKTQIKPDGLVYATGPFLTRHHIVEVERSKVTQDAISDKLESWEMAIASGHDLAGVFVLENRAAEANYITQIGDLPLLTSTIEDVKTGQLKGERTVWRYRGKPTSFEIW